MLAPGNLMVLKMAGRKPNERMLGEDEERELGTGTSIRLGCHRKEVVVNLEESIVSE